MAEKKKESTGWFGNIFGTKKSEAKPAQPAEKPKTYEEKGKDIRSDIDTKRAQERKLLQELKGYKKGGKVKKTGPALLHKGERVLTVKQTKKPAVKTALKKIGVKR